MKRIVTFSVMCNAVYQSELELPDDVKDEDVLDFIQNNLHRAPVSDLEYLDDIEPQAAVTEEDIKEIISKTE